MASLQVWMAAATSRTREGEVRATGSPESAPPGTDMELTAPAPVVASLLPHGHARARPARRQYARPVRLYTTRRRAVLACILQRRSVARRHREVHHPLERECRVTTSSAAPGSGT